MQAALYEQVARISKALASPRRLELVDLLCQGEKTVEELAEAAQISVKLASAHLKELRLARLVLTRKEGKYVVYRLAAPSVAALAVALRGVAEERMAELQHALGGLVAGDESLVGLDSRTVLARARQGELVVIDVRPHEEYAQGHLPHALSLPLPELRKRLKSLPRDLPVVAYCRGPFCLMANEAVELLRRRGFRAAKLRDGVAEWRVQGLPIETEKEGRA